MDWLEHGWNGAYTLVILSVGDGSRMMGEEILR
jgi:hypothetical protein